MTTLHRIAGLYSELLAVEHGSVLILPKAEWPDGKPQLRRRVPFAVELD